MSAQPQSHSDSEKFSKLINAGLQPGSSVQGRPAATAHHYTASGDAQQIINNGAIEIGKLENHYYGTDTGDNDNECGQIVKWLFEKDHNFNQQTAIFKKAWASREPETGLWLLEDDEYKRWLAGQSRAIWLHGGGKLALS